MSDLTRHATWREIHAQPAIWGGWAAALPVADLRAWIAAQAVDEVWFCGAGSSDYVGQIVAAALEGAGRFRAIPTTDIVARPNAYLTGRRPLVVNFGRSGNSAETIGLLDALDALAPLAPRLNITCNAGGVLATRTPPFGGGNRVAGAGSAPGSAPAGAVPGAPADSQRVVVLPEATHDAGFAMTSSFTTMLLTALALFGPHGTAPWPGLATTLASLLPHYAQSAEGPPPERIVFVGSGPLAQAARECALKVMELTAGRIPALWDSSLGFRHGPKSFVQPGTMIVTLLHPDPQTARYDRDLVAELRTQYPTTRVLSAGPGGDIAVSMPDAGLGAALLVPLAQIMAVMWSDRMGLNVDDPFAGQGTLSRVVTGVKLYPVAP